MPDHVRSQVSSTATSPADELGHEAELNVRGEGGSSDQRVQAKFLGMVQDLRESIGRAPALFPDHDAAYSATCADGSAASSYSNLLVRDPRICN